MNSYWRVTGQTQKMNRPSRQEIDSIRDEICGAQLLPYTRVVDTRYDDGKNFSDRTYYLEIAAGFPGGIVLCTPAYEDATVFIVNYGSSNINVTISASPDCCHTVDYKYSNSNVEPGRMEAYMIPYYARYQICRIQSSSHCKVSVCIQGRV